MIFFTSLVGQRPRTVTFRDHRVHPAGLCPASTEPTSPAHAANRKPSIDSDSLFISIPHRSGHCRWPYSFSTCLHFVLSTRLWPSATRGCLRAQRASAGRQTSRFGDSGRVTQFLDSFHTFRALAVVGLMLLDGFRSCEILTLPLEDLKLADAQLHVLGKGRNQRVLPLPGDVMEVLQNYLRLERPLTNCLSLFVSLKGRHRGQPMSPAGLRYCSGIIDCGAKCPLLIHIGSGTMPPPELWLL